MGNYRNKLILALSVALYFGAAQSVSLAQISGIDHYRARLANGQSQRQSLSQPKPTPSRQSRSNVSRAAFQLPVRTTPPPIYDQQDERIARRADVLLLPPGSDKQLWQKPQRNKQPVRLPFGSSSRNVPASSVSTRGNTAINFSRRFKQQVEDVFGEDQVPDQRPSVPENPRTAKPKETNGGNGIVLPPDAMNRLKEPSIFDDEDLVPGITPGQRVPRPDDRNMIPPRRTNDPEPKKVDPERRDSREDSFVQGNFDPSLYDPADPRHPNADNGPESWYRPRPGRRLRSPQPSLGTANQNNYDSNFAPPQPDYFQPAYPQSGYTQPEYAPGPVTDPYPTTGYAPGPHYSSAYVDTCQSGCNGTQGYANGGCNSCGTGIVNGCFDSMFYLSFFGGYTNLSPVTVQDTLGDFRFDLEDGYGLGAALGQYQGRNLRTELEFSFRENDLESLTMPGNPAFIAPALEDAGIRSYSGMANAVWEFRKFPSDRVKPYVGAGFGFVNVEAEAAVGGVNALTGVDDSDSSFGYQAFGGLSLSANEMLDLFVEYRYLKADSLQIGNFGFDYEASNIFGGARIKF